MAARRKVIELKKVNSKYILKSTLTPKLARRDLQRSMSASNLHKSHSCSSLYGNSNRSTIDSNYLTVNVSSHADNESRLVCDKHCFRVAIVWCFFWCLELSQCDCTHNHYAKRGWSDTMWQPPAEWFGHRADAIDDQRWRVRQSMDDDVAPGHCSVDRQAFTPSISDDLSDIQHLLLVIRVRTVVSISPHPFTLKAWTMISFYLNNTSCPLLCAGTSCYCVF